MCQKKNHERQYLRGLVIYLRLQSYRDFTIHREKYKMRQYSFLSKKQCKTLMSKITVFLSYAQDLQWATKRDKIFFQLGPIHGLSLRKSPIKNHATIFWVGLGRQLV